MDEYLLQRIVEAKSLADSRLPASLAQDLRTCLGAREKVSGEQVCMDTARLTSLTLSLYAARHFIQKIQERACFLVGDAAMGVPYFRALN